ncbi:DNA mismatch repair endonuclease MutL [Thalassotalea profundi]|uniref:DNA mismatch repair protein MutL n=1 Tax=Thalassotalea profundi TaxID=2036687 RepID=A0ABQ3J5T2_9GAMM|nr:DNA mismatch repair endonuclease MutL [Thalassotalea profundi]GHF02216.1 DNA mismatch repair protein MutL [Thalassotalea profundi]
MTIEILPARLANQIAAGEVVERPASVVKELVENSLDAGATAIKIDIEKGGAKRIKISDNGCGIEKGELTLALSRHATSKIKDLHDLEGISSLGFRGEALASISSVSRLTLTSKPADQESAWQACAQGRDMEVTILPAAHSDGTTIDVVDLFFNTPARRKFLRTEKTEFSHIEEVIKRIALARFDVSFVLSHNGKIIRQYRTANNQQQYEKRVAQVCGQAFIDNALYLDCQHESLHLHGWMATPNFSRKQNDLCYSYVNGRMMRDKLINHAIRQAYSDSLPAETYPAFVLFLTLNVKEVDVNVHPAKHEVRFHQSRYVHDFIFSVCQQTLTTQYSSQTMPEEPSAEATTIEPYSAREQEYVNPIRQINETRKSDYTVSTASFRNKELTSSKSNSVYQRLMTPLAEKLSIESKETARTTTEVYSTSSSKMAIQWLTFIEPNYILFKIEQNIRLISATFVAEVVTLNTLQQQWEKGLVSQPLLLPIKFELSVDDSVRIGKYQEQLKHIGIVMDMISTTEIRIRQFPALLRQQNISQCFTLLFKQLQDAEENGNGVSEPFWQQFIAKNMVDKTFQAQEVQQLWQQYLQLMINEDNEKQLNISLLSKGLSLNSVDVDLTSVKKQLT